MSAALLTVVATLLVGHPVPVHCRPPPQRTWDGNDAYSSWPPDRIWLRRCRATVSLGIEATKAFAHELILTEHHDWTEAKAYRLERWYARIVVRPTIHHILTCG